MRQPYQTDRLPLFLTWLRAKFIFPMGSVLRVPDDPESVLPVWRGMEFPALAPAFFAAAAARA